MGYVDIKLYYLDKHNLRLHHSHAIVIKPCIWQRTSVSKELNHWNPNTKASSLLTVSVPITNDRTACALFCGNIIFGMGRLIIWGFSTCTRLKQLFETSMLIASSRSTRDKAIDGRKLFLLWASAMIFLSPGLDITAFWFFDFIDGASAACLGRVRLVEMLYMDKMHCTEPSFINIRHLAGLCLTIFVISWAVNFLIFINCMF